MPEASDQAPAGAETALSEAGVWAGLQRFYAAKGLSAWTGRVPFHITSNPLIADCYANVIVRFIGDAVATGRVERSEPFYIIELGGGSGKFGFHLARRLTELSLLSKELAAGEIRIVYIMTDIVETNIDYWRQHPQLQPFVDSGLLAFGRFDVLTDDAVHLMPADGRESTLARFVNPPVVIANYVFDSVPLDMFRVIDGQLQIMTVTLKPVAEDGSDPQPPDSGSMKAVEQLVGGYQPTQVPHYGEPDLDGLLAELGSRSEGRQFVFPVAALRCVRRLVAASAGRLCLLASDLPPSDEPIDTIDLELGDGLFYLAVDLRVVGEYVTRFGPALCRITHSRTFDTSLSIVGFDPRELPETGLAFSSLIDGFGPRAHRMISALISRTGADLEPEDWLALAAMLRYDARLVDQTVARVTSFAASDSLTHLQRQEMLVALARTAENTYWMPGGLDTLYNIGVILDELDEPEAAIAVLTQLLEVGGASPEALFSLGLCLRSVGRYAEALDAFHRAVAIDPDHIMALGWIAQIGVELSAVGEGPSS